VLVGLGHLRHLEELLHQEELRRRVVLRLSVYDRMQYQISYHQGYCTYPFLGAPCPVDLQSLEGRCSPEHLRMLAKFEVAEIRELTRIAVHLSNMQSRDSVETIKESN
jgi:hypothetical protein